MNHQKKSNLLLVVVTLTLSLVCFGVGLYIFSGNQSKYSLQHHMGPLPPSTDQNLMAQAPKEISNKDHVARDLAHKNTKNQTSDKVKKSNKKSFNSDGFKLVELSPTEITSFYKRRGESTEASLEIAGLNINNARFQVQKQDELPKKVSLPLFNGEFKNFVFEHTDFKDTKNFVWVGQGESNKKLNIHISYYNGYFAGEFNTPEGRYEINYLAGNKYVLRRVNPEYYPMNPNDGIMPPAEEIKKKRKGTSEKSSSFRNNKRRLAPNNSGSAQSNNGFVGSLGSDTDTDTDTDTNNTGEAGASTRVIVPKDVVIDVVMGYSPLAESIVGGEGPAIAKINLLFSEANTTHRNSNTGVRFHNREIIRLNMEPVIDFSLELHAMNEALTNSEIYDSSNPYHVLINKKNQHRADLVALFVEGIRPGFCGLAYRNPLETGGSPTYGFSVQSISCHSRVLAHEFGHNLGLFHDRGTQGVGYNFGFKSIEEGFRTVMSRFCFTTSCPRISYFSDPYRTYNNVAMGTIDQSDATRYLREFASVVRDYQPSVDSPLIVQQTPGRHLNDSSASPLQLGVTVSSPALSALSYEWYKDGVLIPGEINSTINITFPMDGLPRFNERHTYYARITNEYGVTQSSDFEVTFSTNLRFTSEPAQSLTMSGSQPLQLDVVATSASNQAFTYQWYRDGITIPGEDSSSLNLTTSSQPYLQATYYVELSNGVDQRVKSSNFEVINLDYQVQITQQPVSGTVPMSGSLELNVRASLSSGGIIGYQWYKNGESIPGANRSSLSLTSLSHYDTLAHFDVEAFLGSDRSNFARSSTVSIQFPRNFIRITRQPEGGIVSIDGFLDLSVEANTLSNQPLKYQWHKKVGRYSYAPIEGETSSILRLASDSHTDSEGRYYVDLFIESEEDHATQQSNIVSVSFPVEEIPITQLPVEEITITQPLQGGDVPMDGSLVLSIGASILGVSNPGFYYEWFQNDRPLPSEDGSTLTLTSSSSNGQYEATYYVVVGSSHNDLSLESAPVTVRFLANYNQPVITTDLSRFYRLSTTDNPLELSVVATVPSDAALGYQWYKDDVEIPGETNSTIQIAPFSHAENSSHKAYYQLKVFLLSDISVAAMSRRAAVYFEANQMKITRHPTGGLVPTKGSIELSVEAQIPARPNETLNYVWYKLNPGVGQWWSEESGQPIPGGTGSTITIRLPLDDDRAEISYAAIVSPLTAGISLYSKPATVTFQERQIEISRQPQEGSVTPAAPLELEVVASTPSDHQLSYQWYKDTLPLPNETGSTLSVAMSAAPNAGTATAATAVYDVEIWTQQGARTRSNSVTVTFPSFYLTIEDQTAVEREDFSLSLADLITPSWPNSYTLRVTDDGGSGITYQDSDKTLRGTDLSSGDYSIRGVLSDGLETSHWSFNLFVKQRKTFSLSKVSTGQHHTCAVTTADGQVSCWGGGLSGELGQGLQNSTSYPVSVLNTDGTTFSGAVQVAAGLSHSCALTSTGEAKCWGRGSEGQLGQGGPTTPSLPITPPLLWEATAAL